MSISISGDGSITGVSTSYTFDKSVSIAGTVSYEDVTSIDAVGIITAQSGIHIDDSIVHLGDTNTKIRFPAADTFTVETAGSERLRVDSSGLVGIKTASPAAPFHVYDATNNTIARLESGDATCRLQVKDSAGEVYVAASGDDLILATTSSVTERLRIDSSGRVMIGNSDAGSLYTNGNNLVVGSGSGSEGITVYTGNSNQGILAFADGTSGGAQQYAGYMIYDHNTNDMLFATQATERLRIDSSGLMFFPDVTADKIQLNGNVANYYRISKLAGGGNLGDGNFKFTSGENTAGGFTFHSGGSEKFRIDSDGDLYQRTQRVHTVLHTEYRHLTGNVSTDSSSYVDIINFGYTPKRSGSLVVCHFQVQTWNGSASNMSGDIYFRARYDQGGGSYTSVQYGGLNERMTGNLDQDSNRQHLYYTHTFGFITQNTNQHTINLQTYNSATLSTDFNWFHTSNNGNGCWIFEYDQ